jgi:nucleoside-diphosphate-sugar epimerase
LSNKILLTGSSGFIGQHLKQLKTNVTYRYVVRRPLKQVSSEQFVITNLDSKTNWDGAFDNINTVIHLAGLAHNKEYTAEEFNEVNTLGTLHLARMAGNSGVKRFVFVSTIGVNGTRTLEDPFSENMKTYPNNVYAKSKLNAEIGLREIEIKTGLEVVIIRPVLVYGAGAPGNFGKLVKLVQKMPFLPFALCRNKRSFVSVENLVDFISTCAKHPKAKNETFCISDCADVSIKEFTNGIAKGLTTDLIQLPIPVFILKLAGRLTGKSEMIDQLVGDLQVDPSKARELLGWTPPVSMAQTFSKLTKVK